MGRFGGRGGRGGGRGGRGGRGGGGGRGGRGVPFKPGPKLGRAVEDELAARDEDDDADDRRSGWDEMGGAPRRKKSVLDRKAMRKRAKEDKAAQRRAWATRHQKKDDGSGGGGGGDASGGDAGKRGASKKRRGGGADEEEDDPRYVKERGGGAKRRRRDDDDDDDDDDARKGRASEKKNPNKPVTLTAEQRMGRSAYEAYKRDEAEQRRLMKKLKGRKGQEDDGMGFFFDSLPGMEILERGDEDRARKESLSAETKKAAASFGDKLAKLRRRDAMESDDDDDDDDDDIDGLDDDDDGSDDDDAEPRGRSEKNTAGDGGVVNFDELDDALEAAFADDSDEDDDDEEDDDDAHDDADEDDDEDDEGEEEEAEEEEAEPKAAPISTPSGKYVPPAQRAAAAAAAARAGGKSESEAKAAAALEDATRRVRGLMNRMGESNVANIAREIAGIARDVPRRAVGDACTAEILKALVDGPRASEQYAAALAAFVAGVSGELGPELAARFGRETLKALDIARQAGNARAASNLCAVFARLHTCGLYPGRVVYGLLTRLVGTLDELDAALMLSLLRCAGPRLRSEDPAGMRDFIASLQTRVAELREKNKEGDDGVRSGDQGDQGGGLTKRARLMLDMVVDLKNNKRVAGAGAGGSGGSEGGDQWGFPAALAKWLRASHAVGDAAVALRALTHERLVDEGAWNRGQWWLPDATGTEAWFAARAAQDRSDSAARNAAASTHDEGAELLAKAKGLRMNTEARRAIFCVIMGAEDFADALDRLLGLPLADKQEREIPRVLIECCLQEKAYNPYYETLATRLCERVKSHRLTLQLCVWDQIREISPTRRNLDGFDRDYTAGGADSSKPKVSVRRIANLARFTAGLLVSGALAPTALKVIDFGGGLDSDERARLHHRLLLQALLSFPVAKRGEVHTVFQGIARGGSGRASRGEMGALRASLGQALGSVELLEGLPKGDGAVPGTVKYVKKAAREASNILQGMLA